MKTLIRSCIMLHLIEACTICLCPIKKILGLHGFICMFSWLNNTRYFKFRKGLWKLQGYMGLNARKVNKGAKIRNRYNQVPHLDQDTNGKVSNSQLDTINENQEVSSFQAGDHKAPDCSLWTTTAQTSLHIRAVWSAPLLLLSGKNSSQTSLLHSKYWCSSYSLSSWVSWFDNKIRLWASFT